MVHILDRDVFNPTNHKQNAFTVRDLCSGVQIFGGTGSGKTSGSGQELAVSLLKLKKEYPSLGGLVLTAKPDEVEHWQDMLKKVGIPKKDIVIFGEDNKHCFNFLDYECTRKHKDAGKTINIVSALKLVASMAQSKGGNNDGGDFFWVASASTLLTHIINFIKIAGIDVTIENIHQIFEAIPQSLDDAETQQERYNEAKNELLELGEDDEAKSLQIQSRISPIILGYIKVEKELLEAQEQGLNMPYSLAEQKDFKSAYDYLMREYPKISDKTRSGIDATLRLMYTPFMQNELRELFTNKSTITPEDVLNGKILIINLPILQYAELGRVAQSLWKYFIQKAVERRQVKQDTAPLFIWADESQYFINEHDQLFLTTSRSQRCITVYLTQNIENYIVELGEHRTYAMLGNFQTKIFHQNSDIETNQYASNVIGRRWQNQESHSYGSNTSSGTNSSVSYSGGSNCNYSLGSSSGEGQSQGVTVSQIHEYLVQPYIFNTLKNGSPKNDFMVEAFIYKSGQEFIVDEVIFESKYMGSRPAIPVYYSEITIKASFYQKKLEEEIKPKTPLPVITDKQSQAIQLADPLDIKLTQIYDNIKKIWQKTCANSKIKLKQMIDFSKRTANKLKEKIRVKAKK